VLGQLLIGLTDIKKARKDVLIPKQAHFFGTICFTRRQISLKQADTWPLLPFLGLLK